jgi:uncharacterized protein
MHEYTTENGKYIPRSLEPILEKAASQFPAVVLIGPRQSGKSTLVRHVFGDRFSTLSLEAPDVRAAAAADPRGFLALNPPPLILDEVQYAPGLLPYIKESIDENRSTPGQFILTGSQNLLLMQQVTESLAGRAAVLKLLPLTFREILKEPQKKFPWESKKLHSTSNGLAYREIWQQTLTGFFPEIACNRQRDFRLWQSSYVQTYLERDVRSLRNIGDLSTFQIFLRALAGRAAQQLNLSELARDVGISVNTTRDWLSILEASFQVFILRPYFVNFGKRLIKSPKVYFTDTGLLCYLVGLNDMEHAIAGPMGGAIFENLVTAEIHKSFLHRGEEPPLYYWRTAAGNEVDLLVETQDGIVSIEIKSSATMRPEMAKGILQFRRNLGGKSQEGFVIYPGDMVLPLGENVLSLPLNSL